MLFFSWSKTSIIEEYDINAKTLYKKQHKCWVATVIVCLACFYSVLTLFKCFIIINEF